jgi:hypothetical protein
MSVNAAMPKMTASTGYGQPTAPPSNTVLAGLARAEAERHPPRTPERRAAAWVFVAASETKTVAAARRALSDCPDPSIRYAATVLLGQLAGQDAAKETSTCPPGGWPAMHRAHARHTEGTGSEYP